MENMDTTVLYEVKNNIAYITLNRTKVGNCISRELANMTLDAFMKAENDRNVFAVVFAANGKAFCTGGDVPYLDTLKSPAPQYDEIHNTGKIIKFMTSMDKPIVGAIQGFAVGAGLGFALACDILMCSQNANFMCAFSNVGLASDCGTAYMLTKAVGKHKAKELLMLSDVINAQQLKDLGVVNYIVENEALIDEATAIANRLGGRAYLSNAYIKSLVNKSDTMSLVDSIAYEETIQTVCLNSSDFHEGARAFAEKRKPVFKGEE